MKRIMITGHARDSIKQRIGCGPEKFEKIARKAWLSQEPFDSAEVPNQRFYQQELYKKQNIVYRKLMGKIFVFNDMHDKAVLITCFRPVVGVMRYREKYFKEYAERQKRNEKFKSQRTMKKAYGESIVS